MEKGDISKLLIRKCLCCECVRDGVSKAIQHERRKRNSWASLRHSAHILTIPTSREAIRDVVCLWTVSAYVVISMDDKLLKAGGRDAVQSVSDVNKWIFASLLHNNINCFL